MYSSAFNRFWGLRHQTKEPTMAPATEILELEILENYLTCHVYDSLDWTICLENYFFVPLELCMF